MVGVYAPEKIPYAIDLYVKETARLYAVLDKQLAGRDFIAGDYSIADIACYPWVVPYERQQQEWADFPNVQRWFEAIRARPATQRAYARAEEINPSDTPSITDASRQVLFGQMPAPCAAQRPVRPQPR